MILLILLKFCLSLSFVTCTGYNETEARVLLDLAAAAYSHTPEACINRTLSSDAGWKIYTELFSLCDIIDSVCSGYVLRSDKLKKIIVVFRGTKTNEQLLIEGNQSFKPGDDFFGIGEVNKYFKNALDSLWPRLEPLLKDDIFKNYDVTFTGHSLGGALASLAAVRTVLQKYRSGKSIKLYTFGEPRIGNRNYAKKHDELIPNSYRVVYRADIIPHVPPCRKNDTELTEESKPCDPNDLSAPYHHGVEIWYPVSMEKGSKYIECRGEPKNEDFNCSDSLTFQLSNWKDYVADHRTYFTHLVTKYGKLGCVELSETANKVQLDLTESKSPKKTSGIKSVFQTVINIFKSLAHKF